MEAPNILNYLIGKGKVEVRPYGTSGAFRNIGNVPEIELTPEIETLEHESSQEGVAKVDRVVTRRVGATLRIVLDEFNIDNLKLALGGGDTEMDTQGRSSFKMLAATTTSLEVKFTGQNSVGPRFEHHFFRVDFTPEAGVPLISEEWAQQEISGALTAVDGDFGTVALIAEEGETPTA